MSTLSPKMWVIDRIPYPVNGEKFFIPGPDHPIRVVRPALPRAGDQVWGAGADRWWKWLGIQSVMEAWGHGWPGLHERVRDTLSFSRDRVASSGQASGPGGAGFGAVISWGMCQGSRAGARDRILGARYINHRSGHASSAPGIEHSACRVWGRSGEP